MKHRASSSGVYVIELSPAMIKVGMSKDTDSRINTHVRNARGLGHDPYRYRVFPVPPELLRPAERRAHAAVRAAGGVAAPRSPEVFSGVYYNPVLALVERVAAELCAFEESMARLRAMSARDLDRALAFASPDVAVVIRQLRERLHGV